MKDESKTKIIDNYRNFVLKYGSGPLAVQSTLEGQIFRFEKLAQIGNLTNCSVLDLGCGIGDYYPFLIKKFGVLDYTGIDIVPESINIAKQQYPNVNFMCRDITEEDLNASFDYILICGVFNNAIPDATEFLKELTSIAFKHCKIGIGFNFVSKYVTFIDPNLSYHDPGAIFDFCIKQLSPKVMIHHHYKRCDVATFVYK